MKHLKRLVIGLLVIAAMLGICFVIGLLIIGLLVFVVQNFIPMFWTAFSIMVLIGAYKMGKEFLSEDDE